MTINFNKPILNYKGEEMKVGGQIVLIKDIVCNTLSTVVDADKEDKIALSVLVGKIWSAKEEMNLTPEECVMVRKNITSLPASIFAQVYAMLG